MTTILKAVQEIEARAAATPPATSTVTTPTAPPEEVRRATVLTAERSTPLPAASRVVVVRVLATMAAAIAIGAVVVMRTGAPPQPETIPVGDDAAHVAATDHAATRDIAGERRRAVQAPAAAGAPAVAVPAEAPWARIEKRGADVRDTRDATVASVDADDEAAPAADARPATAPRRADAHPAPPPRRAGAPARPADAAPRVASPSAGAARTAAVGGRSASTTGGVRVEVTAISYAPDVAQRTAALRIAGRAVTLRQGESASGVEVQLIEPDAVYLRSGKDIFAIDAPSRGSR